MKNVHSEEDYASYAIKNVMYHPLHAAGMKVID